MSNLIHDPEGKLKGLAKSLRPQDIPDHLWEFESISADGTRKTYIYTDPNTNLMFRKTVNELEIDLLEANREMYNDSDGKRWGDGQIAARVPMNVYMREFAPRRREGDEDFVKWWLNRDEHRMFRTFKGKGRGRV